MVNKKTAQMIGPQIGKLYRVTNLLGSKFMSRKSSEAVSIGKDDIFLVTSSELHPHTTSPGDHLYFVFTIIHGEQIYEDLLAFPVWFHHNFKKIQ